MARYMPLDDSDSEGGNVAWFLRKVGISHEPGAENARRRILLGGCMSLVLLSVAALLLGDSNLRGALYTPSLAVNDLHSGLRGPPDTLSDDLHRACTVYCNGELLETIQRAGLFNDSKEFVDMPMRVDPEEITTAFNNLPDHSRGTLSQFVKKYFYAAGSDLVPAELPDYKPNPPFITKIKNVKMAEWAKGVHNLWQMLGRKTEVTQQWRHSLFHLPGDLVVPGGRFRETYYWDSFWIVKGLIASGMLDTAKQVTRNFLYQVQHFGFVPNGGRVYYMNRSQPPLLSDMVAAIFRVDADIDFLKLALPILDKEYQFWMSPRGLHLVHLKDSSSGKTYSLNRYFANTTAPRPESMTEDLRTSKQVDASQRPELYKNIASGAESGWDYSSRWLRDETSLPTIATTEIVPADLNAILYRVEKNLAAFHRLVGGEEAHHASQAVDYDHASERRKEALDKFLWDEKTHQWRDYWYKEGRQSDVTAISNFIPIWAGAYDRTDEALTRQILTAFNESGLMEVAGIRTTILETGQQWDSPNAWPPMQHMMIEGFNLSTIPEGQQLARELTHRWLETGLAAWDKYGHMFEKYNAMKFGEGGAGGEYKPQVGFGWTNGVVLDLLSRYGDDPTLFKDLDNDETKLTRAGPIVTFSDGH